LKLLIFKELGEKTDECHKNVMLVWCGGIYLVFGGRFWKKKAPLGAHEIYTKFTGKMESEGKPILANHAHFCPGGKPQRKAM